MNINEINVEVHGDVKILSRYDTERFAWVVTAMRRVRDKRYGAGVIVEDAAEIEAASEYLRMRISDAMLNSEYEMAEWTIVRFDRYSMRDPLPGLIEAAARYAGSAPQ